MVQKARKLLLYLLRFIHLFGKERERERERERKRDRLRENVHTCPGKSGGRESQVDATLSVEPDGRLDLTTHEIMT